MNAEKIKNNERKEQGARGSELRSFASQATVSVWKSHGSTFADYESKVTKGLILRVEDRSEKADKWPSVYRNRIVKTWLLQCGGKYPIEIGDFGWARDDAYEMVKRSVKRLRAGDEREIVYAYLVNTEVASRDSEEERSLLSVAGLSYIEQTVASAKVWFEGLALESGSRWFAEDRRRVRRLESLLKRVRAFAKREGLKIRQKLAGAPEQTELRRVA
jgi:hypothetical protein